MLNMYTNYVHDYDVTRDENILYIRRYISDIFDIDDVRHDIGDDRYITDISVLD